MIIVSKNKNKKKYSQLKIRLWEQEYYNTGVSLKIVSDGIKKGTRIKLIDNCNSLMHETTVSHSTTELIFVVDTNEKYNIHIELDESLKHNQWFSEVWE